MRPAIRNVAKKPGTEKPVTPPPVIFIWRAAREERAASFPHTECSDGDIAVIRVNFEPAHARRLGRILFLFHPCALRAADSETFENSIAACTNRRTPVESSR